MSEQPGSIGEEAMRRAMVGDGLDPTDPEQRQRYGDTARGSLVKATAELDGIGRAVTGPARWVLDRINRACGNAQSGV